MSGLLLMIAISALVGWLTSFVLGTVGGIIVGFLAFIIWFRFNQKQGTTGLYKANLSSYFAYRKSGQTVNDALLSMIHARYRLSSQKLNRALPILSTISESEAPETSVTKVVFTIFCIECGPPPEPERYKSVIKDLYCKMSQTYGTS